MKLRKILAWLLLCALLCSLGGCAGEDAEVPQPEEDTETELPEVLPEEEPEDAPEEVPAEPGFFEVEFIAADALGLTGVTPILSPAELPAKAYILGEARMEVAAEMSAETLPYAVLTVPERAVGRRDAELRIPLGEEYAPGDSLVVSFCLRDPGEDESGISLTADVVGIDEDSWLDRSYVFMPEPGEWRQYYLVAQVPEIVTGGAELVLDIGWKAQMLELGGVSAVAVAGGLDKDARKLVPETRIGFNYRGMEADAPWRAEAEVRIGEIRRGALEVQVVDSEGNPIAGADVHVEMLSHAYDFGTAVAMRHLTDTPNEDQAKYQQIIEEYFNCVVAENSLKWPPWEGEWGGDYGQTVTFRAVDWLEERNIPLRGHVLFWPSWDTDKTPAYLQSLSGDPDALRTAILQHIEEETTAMQGHVFEWDVINEAYANRDVTSALGDDPERPQIFVDAFKTAREFAGEDVKLYYNDYDLFSNSGVRAFETTLLSYLVEQGAPIDGYGEQAHVGTDKMIGPERVLEMLDEQWAATGLQMKITEYDFTIALPTEDAYRVQSDYTRDLMTAIFSHESSNGFMVWGFWAGAHWIESAAMFTRDWEIMPWANTWYELVHEIWWTDEIAVTDAGGVARSDAYLGDYRITVTVDGKTVEQNYTITENNRSGVTNTLTVVCE